MKLVKVITKDTLAIEGRTYSAIDKGNNLLLTHTLASTGLVQLNNPVVVDPADVELLKENVTNGINTNTGTKKAKIQANPYGLRKDVFSFDCNDCKKDYVYCGAVHNV